MKFQIRDLLVNWRICATRALQKFRGLPIWLTDEAVSLQQITMLVSSFDPAPLGLLIVDYLQAVRTLRDIDEPRFQVEAVSQGLKTLAVQHQIPVVCLSSLSRPQKERETRPTLASLRESGELEHDADIEETLPRLLDSVGV